LQLTLSFSVLCEKSLFFGLIPWFHELIYMVSVPIGIVLRLGKPCGGRKVITEFKVSGMHCNSCISLIKMSVQELEGITDVFGEQEKGFVRVSYGDSSVSVKDILKKIEKEGYKVTGFGNRKK